MVKLQEDYERMVWRLWCVIVALIVVGALLWGGVLVVNTPRSNPAWVDRFAAVPPPVGVPSAEDVEPPAPFHAPPAPAAAAVAAPVPLGGPGIVWVNTNSGVYHFPGSRWYGRTIQGKYTTEEDAIAEGDRTAKNERRPLMFNAAKR